MYIVSFVSLGDNLHEMSNPSFWKKIRKNTISLSSAEFVHSVLLLLIEFMHLQSKYNLSDLLKGWLKIENIFFLCIVI